ncbi:MAG TPA: pyridoxal phosphate-dependent aminotransferase [Geothermobacteraceae bacterium]|nr:pyridoxal phosphate-dependent aminotransferase [Geothermobacteraceae bacterium]
MPIADKVKTFIERASWIRKMFEEGARLREIHGAENIFDFTLGNPTVDPPAAFNAELKKLAEAPEPGMHRYMNNAGYDATRGAVAAKLASASGQPVKANQVIMTCGAGGALNVVLKTILNPGDEVIILTPYFVEYKFYIDNHGGVPREVWTRKEDFQLDLVAIESAINEKTAALIINSPNNPTGVIYPEADLQALDALLKRKEQQFGRPLLVISDEPYARIAFDGKQVPPVFASIDNSVIVTSHSKDLALPGERIGYLAASPGLRDLGEFMEGAVFCNRVLGFVNAPAMAQRLVAHLQDASVDIDDYQQKRDLLYQELSTLGFKMVKPDGAFYLFPESPLSDDVAFVRKAQEHNLLLVPGSGFGAPGYFRIAYCIELEVIERSLPAWRNLANDLRLG